MIMKTIVNVKKMVILSLLFIISIMVYSQDQISKPDKWDKKRQRKAAKHTYNKKKHITILIPRVDCNTKVEMPQWMEGDEYSKKAARQFRKLYGEEYNGRMSFKVSTKVSLSEVSAVKNQVTIEDARKRAFQNAREQFVKQYFDRFVAVAEVGGSPVIDLVSLEQSMYDWVSLQDVNLTPIFVYKQEFVEDICPNDPGFYCFMWCYIDNTLFEERMKDLENSAQEDKQLIKSQRFEDWFRSWQNKW